jgi:hypothetical protein
MRSKTAYLAALVFSFLPTLVSLAQDNTGRDPRFVTDPAGDRHLETIEYFVPHVSTVPATAGEEVMLFVRERVRVHGRRERPAVLMVTGATTSAIPVFDLEFQQYSWMTHLARAGFDVFVMELTGYGFSPRPFMDDPATPPPHSSRLP